MKRSMISAVMLVIQILVLGAWVVLGRSTEAPETQAELGSAFTYQGKLDQNGSPVTGSCDLRFGLWDAVTPAASSGLIKR